jgi:RNA polymerase sigma factor (sigma-70 family)
MSERSMVTALHQHIRFLFTTGTSVGLTDRDLLERFLHQERAFAEDAFEALVERHGPMVLRVCNQVLKDRHAAEDAFQATFLILARQARSIRKRESLESWLFGVACRAAARIRLMKSRRHQYERRAASARGAEVARDSAGIWPELHDEVARLAEKYRIPIVLCYFEGLTHEQAAGRLGWPVGTVKTRLSRAREQLRTRLTRRGLSFGPLMLIEPLRPRNLASVPRVLHESTTRAAAAFASGAGAGGRESSAVLAITEGVLKAMLFNKRRQAAIILFGAAVLGTCATILARQGTGAPQDGGRSEPVSAPARHSTRSRFRELNGTTSFPSDSLTRIHTTFECRVEKVLVTVGESVTTGDPLLVLFSTEIADAKSRYEKAHSRWRRAKAALERKTGPAEDFTWPPAELVDAQDEEANSRLRARVARSRLRIFGLTEEEIEHVRSESGVERAKVTLRSPAHGLVIKRSVVVGNSYEATDTLLLVAQNDRLWVTAGIEPCDAEKLELGQFVTVSFPFGRREVTARVEAKNGEVDPTTGMFSFRASIPNPGHDLKAGTLVKIRVDLDPEAPWSRATDASARRKLDVSLDERTSEIERKLNLRLDEYATGSTISTILERLDEVERKLDRAIKRPTRKPEE